MTKIKDEILEYVSYLYDTFSLYKNVDISPRELRNKMIKADAVRFIWIASEINLPKDMTINIFKDVFGCRFKFLVDNMYKILANERAANEAQVKYSIDIKDIAYHYRCESLNDMIKYINEHNNIIVNIVDRYSYKTTAA